MVHETNNRATSVVDSLNSTASKLLALAVTIAIVAICFQQYISNSLFPSPHCNLTLVANRNFSSYFGVKNLFDADVVDKLHCENNYQLINAENLGDSSYILVGGKGTGKSSLLKCRKSSFMIMKINADLINKTIAVLSRNKHDTKISLTDTIIKSWTKESFAHAAIFSLVKELIDYSLASNKNLGHLTLLERVDLAIIACFYYSPLNEDFENVVKYANQILNLDITDETHPDEALRKFELPWNINVLDGRPKQIHFAVSLYFYLLQKEGISPSIDTQNPFDTLNFIANHIRHDFKQTPVLELDGLDEMQIFNKEIHSRNALEVFYLSAMSSELQELMHERKLLWFYTIPSYLVDFQSLVDKTRLRVQNIRIHHLTWTLPDLWNYADFILDKMRAKQHNQCQILPNFKYIVNYDVTEGLLKDIRHPRDLNLFMMKLLKSFDKTAHQNQYRATYEEVKEVRKMFLAEIE